MCYEIFEYLDEIETEFENTLTCLSEAHMGLNQKETGGLKSRDTISVRELWKTSLLTIKIILKLTDLIPQFWLLSKRGLGYLNTLFLSK